MLVRVHFRIDDKPLSTLWNEFIDEVFRLLDKNGDGSLDRAEAALMPAPQEVFASRDSFGIVGLPGGAAASADADRDGKVTRKELADYYRLNGGAPFNLVQNSGMNELYRRAALDFTGTLPTQGQAEALNKALLAALDTDKDGKLSRKELADAPSLIRKKDGDEDEMVTAAELRGELASNTGYEFIVQGGDFMAPLANGPLVQVNGREANRELARNLLARYARSDESKKGGKLTAKDLGLDASAFKQLDVDEDGKLDAEELARFGRRAPDIEVVVNLGPKDYSVAVKSVAVNPMDNSPRLGGVKKEKDGSLSLEVGNTQLSLKLNSQAMMNQFGGFVRDNDAFYKMQFDNADQDANGYLDMMEARRSGFFASSFKTMDADNDGKLYFKEVTAYLASRKSLRDKANGVSVTMALADQGKGLFDLLDTNGDGRLGVRELRVATELLAKLDRDGDGALSPNEIPRRFQLSAKRGTINAGGGLRTIAVGGMPGVVALPPSPNTGPVWFRRMDRNRDNDVSRREFLGTDEQFRAIDRDGDGLISLKEAEVYDAKMRMKK